MPESGYDNLDPAFFTEAERKLLPEFRKKLNKLLVENPEKDDPYFLIRFLRARNHDLQKAEEMLRKTLAWRKENKIDGILEREGEAIPESFKKRFPTGMFGADEDLNPIICLPLGRFNNREAIKEIGMEKYLRYNSVWMEDMMKVVKDQEERVGKRGLQLVELVDMKEFSFREVMNKPSRDFIIETQQVLEANYPEMLKSILIVNAPKVFALAFKLVKPLMPEETIRKIEVYDQNEEVWMEVVRKRFPTALEKIPKAWGGKLEGSDPFCSTNEQVWPDKSDLSFFQTENSENDENSEFDYVRVKVGPREEHKVEIEVREEGRLLRWAFKTEGHDISFRVHCPQGSEIVERRRLDSHKERQEGQLLCQKRGTYVVVFDNSFSYTRRKVVKYWVALGEES